MIPVIIIIIKKKKFFWAYDFKKITLYSYKIAAKFSEFCEKNTNYTKLQLRLIMIMYDVL